MWETKDGNEWFHWITHLEIQTFFPHKSRLCGSTGPGFQNGNAYLRNHKENSIKLYIYPVPLIPLSQEICCEGVIFLIFCCCVTIYPTTSKHETNIYYDHRFFRQSIVGVASPWYQNSQQEDSSFRLETFEGLFAFMSGDWYWLKAGVSQVFSVWTFPLYTKLVRIHQNMVTVFPRAARIPQRGNQTSAITHHLFYPMLLGEAVLSLQVHLEV